MLGSTQLSIHELAQQTTGRLAAAELHFREALVGVDATVVFAAFALNRLSGMSADGAAKHFRPAPSAVELAAWLCYPEFGKSDVRDGARIQAAINAVSKYEEAFALAEVFCDTQEELQYDELSMHLRLYSGMVRGSAYPSQIYRRIQNVLQPFESELVSFAGVGPCRACEIVRALALQMEDNIQAMRSDFRSVSEEEKTLAEKGDLLTEFERVKLASLHNELRRIVSRVEGDWVPTREQISLRVNGLSDTEWEGLANAIGLTPARLAPVSNVVDVQDTPLFFLNSEQVFCVHGGACFDAIFAFFDQIARSDPALRDRYGLRIASWMEEEVEHLMGRLFPTANIMRSACFVDPDHVGGETEADVIVAWGPFLVVLEAKGKKIPREALRNDVKKLKQTLGKNVQDGFVQSSRIARVLERDGRIRFKEKATGRVIEVKKDHIRRVMPVSVTLQHLSGI